MQNLSYGELSDLLNVKAPLLMLDRLTVDVAGGRADGVKVVSMDEAHFVGHFPGQPVLPGVLQVAGMCQASQTLFVLEGEHGDGVPVVTSLKRVKFRTPVRPGMRLEIECVKSAESDGGAVEYTVKTLADGQLASSGVVTMAMKSADYYCMSSSDLESSPLLADVAGTEWLGPQEIMAYIPHRFPFMFVDRAYGLGDPTKVIGVKNITGNGMFVNATLPAQFPGFLQIEAGAQLGCAAILAQPSEQGKLGFFMSIDSAEFHAPALPGTQLSMMIECELKGRFGIASGKIYAGSRLVTESAIKFAIVTPEEAAGGK
ncbi:MAG: hypothetical protein J6X55_12705 [Victivallales bacterium]|nr:hypothetical protein [Victivallales bacterium]